MRAAFNHKATDILIQAVKIAVGSSIAVLIANRLQLEYALSAGIITMLTIMTTKIETFRLSVLRLFSFWGMVLIGYALFRFIHNDVLAFGLLLLLLIVPSHMLGIHATVSVNAVIATHFLSTRDFSADFVINEFLLVLIGTSIASLLNLIMPHGNLLKKLRHNISYTEQELQIIFDQLTTFLRDDDVNCAVWQQIDALGQNLQAFHEQAYKYEEDSLNRQGSYYVLYFEMRQKQCGILKTLKNDLCNIRSRTTQACVIADFTVHIRNHILEHNEPALQLRILDGILAMMKKEDLPKSRDEFEARAILYHILMSLERFILLKRDFLARVSHSQ